MSRDDLPPRDEHLQAALRHAPDRDLQPPAALSARILEQARREVTPAPWSGRWLTWILKPAGTAAFASVLLAGFIGLMWRGEATPPIADTERFAASAAKKSQPPAGSPGDASRDHSSEARVSASAGAQPEVDTEIGAIRNLSVPAAPPPSASGAGSSVSPAPLLQRREASRERLRTDNALNRLTAPATQAKDAAGSRALPADPLEGAIARLRDAGASAPALESWAQLQAAARGRWQRPNEGARPRGAEVRTPQGTLLGWLAVESSQVRWQAVHEGSVWQVDVPAALAERLRAALLP